MKVAVVDELETLNDLELQWSRLADDLPFCHPGWMLPWWNVYGQLPDRKLFVVCVSSDDGELVGLAPWYRQRASIGGCIVKFLGSGEVCSDYLTVLSAPGQESAVAQQLAAWLADASGRQNDWGQLQFESVPEFGVDVLTGLIEELESQKIGTCNTPSDSCWRIQLPSNMDAYLQTLSRRQRYQIRRGYRREIESGNVTVDIATSPEQLLDCWPTLVDLHQRRREALGEPGCFACANFTKFLHNATLKLGESGKAAIFVLKEDQRPLAVEHQLIGSKTVYAYQSGLDPDRMDIAPGKLANYVTIQSAIYQKKTQFDFLRGDEPYKSLWRAQPIPCKDIRVISNRMSAQVKHQIWAKSQQLKGWMKGTIAS